MSTQEEREYLDQEVTDLSQELASMKRAQETAEAQGDNGLARRLQERIDDLQRWLEGKKEFLKMCSDNAEVVAQKPDQEDSATVVYIDHIGRLCIYVGNIDKVGEWLQRYQRQYPLQAMQRHCVFKGTPELATIKPTRFELIKEPKVK